MQVFRWGNSLAVRLPAAVAEVPGLKEGDDIDIAVAVVGNDRFAVRQSASDHDVLQRLRALRGRLPADFKFDRPEANERCA